MRRKGRRRLTAAGVARSFRLAKEAECFLDGKLVKLDACLAAIGQEARAAIDPADWKIAKRLDVASA